MLKVQFLEYGKRLRAVCVAVQMEAEDKAGLTVQNEPEVVFLALYLHHSFIGVPLVRVEIQRRNELYGNVLEHRGKTGTPVADGRVGHEYRRYLLPILYLAYLNETGDWSDSRIYVPAAQDLPISCGGISDKSPYFS